MYLYTSSGEASIIVDRFTSISLGVMIPKSTITAINTPKIISTVFVVKTLEEKKKAQRN